MLESLDQRTQLERAFRFDALDLQANRAGRLAEAQHEYLAQSRLTLERGHRQGHYMLVGVGVAGLVFAAVFLIVMLMNRQPALYAVAGCAVFALSSAGTIVWGATAKAMPPPMFPDRVESVEGEIFFEAGDDDGWPTMPVLQIEGLKFQVDFAARAVLTNGARYRIYYIQTSVPSVTGVLVAPMILSLEEVPQRHQGQTIS